MRKIGGFLALASCLGILVGACAPTAPTQATPTAIPATQKPAAAPTTAAAAPTLTAPVATPKPAAVNVKIAVTGNIVDAGIYIARDRGYFAEQGVAAELIPFQSFADAIAAMSTGELDIGAGGWTPAVSNAVQRGINLRVVADKTYTLPGFNHITVAVRKDLYDSGQIKEPSQLKGKKIAVTSVASNAWVIAPYLQKGGLTVKDVNLTPLSQPDAITAFANNSIEAASMLEPNLTVAVEQGLAVRLGRIADHHPSKEFATVVFSPKFAENIDAGNRFMVAYVKGIRDYVNAFGKDKKGKKDVVDILAKNTSIKDPTLYDKMDMPGLNPDGYTDRAGLDWALQYWLSSGEMTQVVSIDKMIDNRYVDYAIQKLGKFTN